MRLRIDTTEVQFRVAGPVKPRSDYKDKDKQASTPDGRLIWTLRLDAIEPGRQAKETIWVEVAGDMPEVPFDGFVDVHGLVFAPWVNRQNKIMRSFRADLVTVQADSPRKAA